MPETTTEMRDRQRIEELQEQQVLINTIRDNRSIFTLGQMEGNGSRRWREDNPADAFEEIVKLLKTHNYSLTKLINLSNEKNIKIKNINESIKKINESMLDLDTEIEMYDSKINFLTEKIKGQIDMEKNISFLLKQNKDFVIKDKNIIKFSNQSKKKIELLEKTTRKQVDIIKSFTKRILELEDNQEIFLDNQTDMLDDHRVMMNDIDELKNKVREILS